jgi:hypothetical protein
MDEINTATNKQQGDAQSDSPNAPVSVTVKEAQQQQESAPSASSAPAKQHPKFHIASLATDTAKGLWAWFVDKDRDRDVSDRIIALCTAVLAVVAYLQWSTTDRQLTEMKEANRISNISAVSAKESVDMALRRAEDSDEAICNVRGDIEDGGSIEHIAISNAGKATARAVTAHIEISRNELPSNNRIALLGRVDISESALLPTKPITKDLSIPIEAKDWARIAELREAIVISGTVKYENGFGRVKNETFCHALVKQPPNPGDIPQTPINVLPECDSLPAFMPPLYKRLNGQSRH